MKQNSHIFFKCTILVTNQYGTTWRVVGKVCTLRIKNNFSVNWKTFLSSFNSLALHFYFYKFVLKLTKKMTLLSFLRSFLFFLRPFRSQTFYNDFIQARKSIQAKEATIMRQFKLHLLFFLYGSLHMIYLISDNLTQFQRLIHFDIVFFLVKREFNFVGLPFFSSCIYFAYQMYFTCSETNNSLLLSILNEGDISFFLYPNTDKGQPIDKVISRKMKFAFNSMQTLLVVFGKLTLIRRWSWYQSILASGSRYILLIH